MIKLIIFFLTFTVVMSCSQKKADDYTGIPNPYDAQHPPPPPTQAEIDEAMKNMPSPAETIKAIRNEYKGKGYSEKQIVDIIQQFKDEYKSECPSCYEKIKDL
jgi:hypothetical protein